ncbi:MAG: hypothetical protein CVU18_21380 [Betaproteobacteria bacterium HGW-Betaproteobacteria-12]|nr:MAG: hypothetical protein CVU18_21380 [Betaproteobacteria bacterium HGW-Betaproteobacteria-12]
MLVLFMLSSLDLLLLLVQQNMRDAISTTFVIVSVIYYTSVSIFYAGRIVLPIVRLLWPMFCDSVSSLRARQSVRGQFFRAGAVRGKESRRKSFRALANEVHSQPSKR